jgi:beta-galactosidase
MVYLCAEKAGSATTVINGPNGPTGDESWNWPDKTLLTVSCYTNCPEITLMLNDQSLGTKRLDEAVNGVLHWQVPYVAGVLKAVGRKDGQAVVEFSLKTSGAAKRIELHPDLTQLRANSKDVAQVEFDVVDSQGVRVPDASAELTFELKGPAQILGLGNGDVSNSEPVRKPVHRAYHGRGLAILQSSTTPGPISLRVSSPGLDPATLTLNSQ